MIGTLLLGTLVCAFGGQIFDGVQFRFASMKSVDYARTDTQGGPLHRVAGGH